MIVVPALIIVVAVAFTAALTPITPRRRSYRRRKTKGFIGCVMSKKRGGVMCGPGGARRRK